MTTAPAVWRDLTDELDLWATEDRKAYFWWRDDDAVSATPALERLLALQGSSGVPLALAIIPGQLQESLAACLAPHPGIVALQHGLAHLNHAALPEKKSEFPATRPLAYRVADLQAGQAVLRQHFGDRLAPIFVPPWNRYAPDGLPEMAALGYRAISAFQARSRYWAAPDLAWLNTHVDPVDWHGGDNHAAAGRSLAAACGHLRAMRQGKRALEPLGLLTHHLRHDATVWAFTADFLTTTFCHPAVRWLDARAALPIGVPDAAEPVSPTVTPTS